MVAPCETCPFSDSEGGTRMRRSLRPGRVASIKRGLLRGDAFHCHKTVGHDDEDEAVIGAGARLCAGALAWQNGRGASSNYQRVCESLDYVAERRKARP
jgi:hypothetical protein